MKQLVNLLLGGLLLTFSLTTQAQDIYHKGWIDFNKNGVKDIYEDPYSLLKRGLKTCCNR